MTLVKWRDPNAVRPWSAFRDMEDGFNRLFGELNREFGGVSEWTPAVDVRETEEAYVIEAEMPGLKKDDIEVTVHENMITLKGERKFEREESDKAGYRHVERRYGTFERSFTVPGGFEGDKIDAKYENGVLALTLPKREEEKPKQIDVKIH